MERATIIHSPGGGSADATDLDASRELLGEHFDVDVMEVSEAASPVELARRAVDSGARVLIASGGDGTVSAVGGVLAGLAQQRGYRLGILPRGTANSIAAWLEIPKDVEGACAVITRGVTRVLDTALVNERPMLLMAGVGVHGDAITQVDKTAKRFLGPLSYVLEELSRFATDGKFLATITADGETAEAEISAVTVANLARKATLLAQGPAEVVDDDGLLAVTAVSTEGLADALTTTFHLAASAVADQPAERPNILHFQAREVRIATAEPMRVMVDGEDALKTPVTIRCVPASLTVFSPEA